MRTFEEIMRGYTREEFTKILLYNYPGAYTREEFHSTIKITHAFIAHYAAYKPQPAVCRALLAGIHEILAVLDRDLKDWGYRQHEYSRTFTNLAHVCYAYELELMRVHPELMQPVEKPWSFLTTESYLIDANANSRRNNDAIAQRVEKTIQKHFEKIALEREKWMRLLIQPPDDGMHVARIHSFTRQLHHHACLDRMIEQDLRSVMRAHLAFYKKPYKLPSFKTLFDDLYAQIDALE